MGIKKSKQGADSLTVRNAFDFYTIPLPDDYILTVEALENCIDKKTLKRGGWFYPQLKLLSFKNGTAEIANKLDNTSFRLYIKVEPEKLHVSCSCGMQVEILQAQDEKLLGAGMRQKVLCEGFQCRAVTNIRQCERQRIGKIKSNC